MGFAGTPLLSLLLSSALHAPGVYRNVPMQPLESSDILCCSLLVLLPLFYNPSDGLRILADAPSGSALTV